MPSLVDVARLAGVGLGTASRALSGQGYVKEATMARVQQAAGKLAYRRNELARNLKMKRSGAIGLVIPDIGGPFMATCVRAIQKVLRQAGYKMIITFTDGDEKSEMDEIDYLTSHQIDGLIIIPANSKSKHLVSPQLAHLPVVSFDQPVLNGDYDAVLVNNRKGARDAVQHLIEHGHKRIGCIGVLRQHYSIQKRIEGYQEAMRQAKLSQMLEIVEPENSGIGKQIDQWVASKMPPTAIFSLNELTSLETVQAFAVRGIAMPDQIAFIGFDDIQLGPYLSPPLTAIVQPAAEIGESAATQLLRRMSTGESLPTKRILLDATLVVRGSCGCKYTRQL